MRAEVEFMDSIRHHNIVQFYDYKFHDEKKVLYIYMEYCPSGDLGQYIKLNRRCKEDFIWRILVQLVSALHLCHAGHSQRADKRIIVHCDLKPENSKNRISKK